MSLGPLMIDLAGTDLTSEDRRLLAHPMVGGVLLFSRNFSGPAQVTELVQQIHAARTPPLISGLRSTFPEKRFPSTRMALVLSPTSFT